jgi:DNA-binding NtrC family response regulator
LPEATPLNPRVFEAASGGTLFLDEIGDIPSGFRADLLRVIDRREIFLVGESRPRQLNIRVIAAARRDVAEGLAIGHFPPELLYRIRIARIRIPPLRERTEDIPWLMEAFLSENRASTGKPPVKVSSEAMRRLIDYSWPGNVRELESAVNYAAAHCRGTVLRLEDFPEEVHSPRGRTPAIDEPVQADRKAHSKP